MLQRQNLEAVLDCVADGVVAADLSLRVSNLNHAAQTMLGWSRAEAQGQSCARVLGTDDGSELEQVLQQRRPVDALSVTARSRSGQPLRLVVSTRVLRDHSGGERGLVAIVRDTTELESLRGRLRHRRSGIAGLVGQSQAMQAVYQLIEDLDDSDATVLILGESGTGKELVADAIHRHSRRQHGPFVKVNCSALSEGLLESELFGHVKGAFTGAVRDTVGRFEQADGGTIFLDEIGDLSATVQVKLLRILQERQIERVGSGLTRPVDTRVIAATHRNLRAAMQDGSFRQDLFFRLNVMPVEVPPLRARRDDIPLLVAHFIEAFAARTGRPVRSIDDAALGKLMAYDWPGNVRELANAIEHAFVRCRDQVLQVDSLPALGSVLAPPPSGSATGHPSAAGRAQTDRARVLAVLEQHRWNRARAAAALGMHRTTLWRHLRDWGLDDRSA